MTMITNSSSVPLVLISCIPSYQTWRDGVRRSGERQSLVEERLFILG